MSRGAWPTSPVYLHDAWDTESVRAIPADADILLIGTGLTMIDWAFSLGRHGHRGTIHALSRRGLLPRSHGPAAVVELGAGIGAAPATALGLSRAVRAEIGTVVEQPAATGGRWSTLCGPRTQGLWAALPIAERAPVPAPPAPVLGRPSASGGAPRGGPDR